MQGSSIMHSVTGLEEILAGSTAKALQEVPDSTVLHYSTHESSISDPQLEGRNPQSCLQRVKCRLEGFAVPLWS